MNTYSEDKMYENYSSEIERMQKCIDELQQEIKLLKIQASAREEVANKYKEVIDEAREYIEGFYYPDERQLTHEFDGWNLAKLYDILNKGDNNE